MLSKKRKSESNETTKTTHELPKKRKVEKKVERKKATETSQQELYFGTVHSAKIGFLGMYVDTKQDKLPQICKSADELKKSLHRLFCDNILRYSSVFSSEDVTTFQNMPEWNSNPKIVSELIMKQLPSKLGNCQLLYWVSGVKINKDGSTVPVCVEEFPNSASTDVFKSVALGLIDHK